MATGLQSRQDALRIGVGWEDRLAGNRSVALDPYFSTSRPPIQATAAEVDDAGGDAGASTYIPDDEAVADERDVIPLLDGRLPGGDEFELSRSALRSFDRCA